MFIHFLFSIIFSLDSNSMDIESLHHLVKDIYFDYKTNVNAQKYVTFKLIFITSYGIHFSFSAFFYFVVVCIVYYFHTD